MCFKTRNLHGFKLDFQFHLWSLPLCSSVHLLPTFGDIILAHLLTLLLIFTDTLYKSVVCMLHNFLFWYICRTIIIAQRSWKVGMGDHGSIGMSKEELGNSGFILHIFFNCWLQMVVQWNKLHYSIVESKRKDTLCDSDTCDLHNRFSLVMFRRTKADQKCHSDVLHKPIV